jgi:mono/diheme cytochrome c family protein
MWIKYALLLGYLLQPGLAWSQDTGSAQDIRQGHHIASVLCSLCHVATPDQATLPIRHPPARPFASILQRKDLTAEWLANFLKTTHGGLNEPDGMPNPDLTDFQIKQIVAYLMSLHPH